MSLSRKGGKISLKNGQNMMKIGGYRENHISVLWIVKLYSIGWITSCQKIRVFFFICLCVNEFCSKLCWNDSYLYVIQTKKRTSVYSSTIFNYGNLHMVIIITMGETIVFGYSDPSKTEITTVIRRLNRNKKSWFLSQSYQAKTFEQLCLHSNKITAHRWVHFQKEITLENR